MLLEPSNGSNATMYFAVSHSTLALSSSSLAIIAQRPHFSRTAHMISLATSSSFLGRPPPERSFPRCIPSIPARPAAHARVWMTRTARAMALRSDVKSLVAPGVPRMPPSDREK